MSVVTGRTIPSVKVATATIFDGTNPIAQARLEADPTTPGGNGVEYEQASFTAIYYTVYRESRGRLFVVPSYDELALTVSAVVYDALQGWSEDTRGFNFQHVIPLAALESTAKHIVVYRFALANGINLCTEHKINYRGLGNLAPASGGDDDDDDDEGGDSNPIIFSATSPVTVSNTATDSTLIGSGVGSAVIPADSWSNGETRKLTAYGVYSTKGAPAGGMTLAAKLATDVTLSFVIPSFLSNRSNALWQLSVIYTRLTSTTIVASARLLMADVNNDLEMFTGTTAAQTVAANASKAVDLRADWDTADASNSITQLSCVLTKEGIAS